MPLVTDSDVWFLEKTSIWKQISTDAYTMAAKIQKVFTGIIEENPQAAPALEKIIMLNSTDLENGVE